MTLSFQSNFVFSWCRYSWAVVRILLLAWVETTFFTARKTTFAKVFIYVCASGFVFRKRTATLTNFALNGGTSLIPDCQMLLKWPSLAAQDMWNWFRACAITYKRSAQCILDEGWRDGRIIFSIFSHSQKWNFAQRHKNVAVGDLKFCQKLNQPSKSF